MGWRRSAALGQSGARMTGPDSNRIRRWVRHYLLDACGGVLVFVAIGLPLFLLMAALVFDIGLARLHNTRLQIAADAAAYAAAAHPDDLEAARAAALDMADRNYPGTLDISAVQLVHWDGVTRSLNDADPDNGRPANAVSVTTRRDAETNSVLPYVFGKVAGLGGDGFSLAARSVAASQAGGGCDSASGVFSDNALVLRISGRYTNSCLYGRTQVSVASNVTMDDATAVIAPELARISEPARSENGVAASLDLVLPGLVDGIIATAEARTEAPDRPEHLHMSDDIARTLNHGDDDTPSNSRKYMCSTGRERQPCADDDPFTHHVWQRGGNNDVDITIPNNVTYRDMILQTDGDIILGQRVTLENVTLWAGGDVVFRNRNDLTDVNIRAGGAVSIGDDRPANNVQARNVRIWAAEDIDVVTQKSDFANVEFRSGGEIAFGGRGSGSGNTTTASGAIFVSQNDTEFANNVHLFGVEVMSRGRVIVEDSNNANINIRIGNSANACGPAETPYENYIFARGSVWLGRHTWVHGTQIGSRSSVDLGNDIRFVGSSAEMTDRGEVGADALVAGCAKSSVHGAVDVSGVTGGSGAQVVLVQ